MDVDMDELLPHAEDPYDENEKQVVSKIYAFWKQYQKPICLIADTVYAVSAILSAFLFGLVAIVCIHQFCHCLSYGEVFPSCLVALENWLLDDIPHFLGRLAIYSIFLRWLCSFLYGKIPELFPRSKYIQKAQPVFYVLLCLISTFAAIALNDKSNYSMYMETSHERVVFLGQALLCILVMSAILMVLHRKSKTKYWCFFAGVVSAVVYAGCFLIYEFDITGRVNYVPDVDEVASVSFYKTDFSELDNIAACTAIHREILEAKTNSLPKDLNLTYTLKDGSVITRHYAHVETNTVNEEQQLKDSTLLLNSLEGLRNRTLILDDLIDTDNWSTFVSIRFKFVDEVRSYYTSDTITESEMEDFYRNCLVPDVLDGKAGEISLTDLDEDFQLRNSNVFLEYSINAEGYSGSIRTITFRMDADRCMEWIKERNYFHYPIQTMAEYYADYATLEEAKK